LNADGPTPVSGPGNSQQVTNQSVDPGSYDLSETNGPPGYAASDWVCDGGMQSGASVDVALGDGVTCTITNDDQAALLTLVKVVDNGTTGGTAEPADWQLTADGPTPVSGDGNSPEVTDQPVDAGTYDLSEANGPAGYAASDWSCEGGTQNGASVDIAVGDDVTCTITNTAQQAHLTLVKEVVNDNGGTATPEQWTLTADGPTPVSGDGNSPEVTGQPVDPGSYDLSESGGPAGYAASDWSCDGGTQNGASVDIALGDDVTCTIINDDEIAHLTLVKVVVNDNGGTAVDTDWTLSADGPTPITGTTGDPAVTDAVVDAGDYALTEDGPSGYAASDWVCDGGDLTGGTVTVPNGGDVTCTITNDDQQAQLTLVKVVDNGDTGGTAVPSDWTLSADGPTPITGAGNSAEVTDQPVDAGSYDLSEADGPDGYTASAWECVGGSQSGASVDIAVGDDVTCTITNTAQPSRWTLEKTSDPQSPSTVNPGDEITYTITASKLGGVDPTGVVVTDDLSSVLDNATLVAGSIDPSTGTATQNGNQIVWDIGTLSGDETLSYRVRVNDGAYGVQLRNVASGTAVTPPEECPAPAELRPVARAFIAARRAATWSAIANPKAAAEDPCSTVHRTPKWTLSKASDPTSGSTIDPGSVVTYTLTATNVSDAEVNHAVVHDDLSNVLNHATLIAVPAGATLNGTTLTWNVPPMPANGDQETLTYSVRIDADAADVTIGNVATPGAGGSCVTACETTHKTPATLPTQTENPPPPGQPPSGPLVNTGGPSEALVWAGLLLLLVGGGGIYFATRRRRSDHAG
jgi:uncharacterized repeat protein (TIGR01451 family)/fimbrial isopeptide formation D2 family protein